MPTLCPRCRCDLFWEIDCGHDGYDGITYTSYRCNGCDLWYDGWRQEWLVDCWGWRDADDCEVYDPDDGEEL